MNDTSTPDRDDIGWGRAIASGIVVVVAVFASAVYGSNAILTKLTGMSRDNREYLASFVFLAVVVVAAWALRRLQARGTI